ncbi:MAG: phosphopantetheine-binding protein [Oscillospiraceae bacterium]|jgi:acyl carrier protein|nr:phosphopantetheine-binding protein [Oscillospiraceae bacterium]
MDILGELQTIVREYTGDSGLCVHTETTLTAGLGLDSYDLVMLLCTLEERFALEIPDRAAAQMVTAGDLADYLEKHKGI